MELTGSKNSRHLPNFWGNGFTKATISLARKSLFLFFVFQIKNSSQRRHSLPTQYFDVTMQDNGQEELFRKPRASEDNWEQGVEITLLLGKGFVICYGSVTTTYIAKIPFYEQEPLFHFSWSCSSTIYWWQDGKTMWCSVCRWLKSLIWT